jgi:hypothetical protein
MAGRRKEFSKGRVYTDFCAWSTGIERDKERKNDRVAYFFMADWIYDWPYRRCCKIHSGINDRPFPFIRMNFFFYLQVLG